MAGMTLFDWFIVIVIRSVDNHGSSAGLVLEVVSLAALVLGLWLAFWNYGVLAAPLSRVIHSVGVADVLAFLLIALGVMLIIGLIGRAISKVARTAGLGGLDSLLGADFWSDSRLFSGGRCYHSNCRLYAPEDMAERIEAGTLFSVCSQPVRSRCAGRIAPEDSRGSGNHQARPRLDSIPLASSPSHTLEH